MLRETGLFLLYCDFHVFCCSQFLIVMRFVQKWQGDRVGKVGHDVFWSPRQLP